MPLTLLVPRLAALPVKEFTLPADPKETVPAPPITKSVPDPPVTLLVPTERSKVVLVGKVNVFANVTPPDKPLKPRE